MDYSHIILRVCNGALMIDLEIWLQQVASVNVLMQKY